MRCSPAPPPFPADLDVVVVIRAKIPATSSRSMKWREVGLWITPYRGSGYRILVGMSWHPITQPALLGGPFLAREACAAGLLTPGQLRGSGWRQVFRGVYASAELPDSVQLRAQAAALLLPTGGAASGRTAAYLLGVDVRAQIEPVEVTVPRAATISGRPGLAVRRGLLPADDVVEVCGVPVTGPLRTAFDLGRRPRRGERDRRAGRARARRTGRAGRTARVCRAASGLARGSDHRRPVAVRRARYRVAHGDPAAVDTGSRWAAPAEGADAGVRPGWVIPRPAGPQLPRGLAGRRVRRPLPRRRRGLRG